MNEDKDSMLNPGLDFDDLAKQFQLDDRLRIQQFLDDDLAARTATCCETKVPFDFIYHLDGENRVTSARDMAAISLEEQKSMHQKLMRDAAQGVGFLYGGYMMKRPNEEPAPELDVIYKLYEYLGSDEALAAFRTITGIEALSGIDAQFTRYTSGQYLTRHSDNITAEGRRVAFVLGFSRNWHPDWGGMLQFYENDGTPRDAWLPEFNTLSLFDVRHIHSVSYVTPFAPAPRLSLTGWLTTG